MDDLKPNDDFLSRSDRHYEIFREVGELMLDCMIRAQKAGDIQAAKNATYFWNEFPAFLFSKPLAEQPIYVEAVWQNLNTQLRPGLAA